MLIKKKNRNIIKNIINRKILFKQSYDCLNILKKSYNIKLEQKILNSLCNKKTILNKICINTGRYSSVYKKINLTRQQINKNATLNKLDNFNITSW